MSQIQLNKFYSGWRRLVCTAIAHWLKIVSNGCCIVALAVITATVAGPVGIAKADGSILFVRGADRSGGHLEANNDWGRTEHLSDIYNASTHNGNHGWHQLRVALENAGFKTSQIKEKSENSSGPCKGISIDFARMDLSPYDVIVFGSNNATYDGASVEAIERFVRGGGGALFISDTNFGGDWSDAPNSDQQFLSRFGWVMNQDHGTYALSRSGGNFPNPSHPVLSGVSSIDGEGVSPIAVGGSFNDVRTKILATAKGSTRVNKPPFGNLNKGDTRGTNRNDASAVVAEVSIGRIAGHFDRNTFFNSNGAGTNINRHDNKKYAINLFTWLAGGDEDGGVPAPPTGLTLIDTAGDRVDSLGRR